MVGMTSASAMGDALLAGAQGQYWMRMRKSTQTELLLAPASSLGSTIKNLVVEQPLWLLGVVFVVGFRASAVS